MSWLPGDRYRVFYCAVEAPNSTVPAGTFYSWAEAKRERNGIFGSGAAVAVWIMRDNPSLGSRPEKFGAKMERTK